MSDELSPAEAFFQEFLLPLIYGQEVTIGLPIEADTWEEIAADVSTQSARFDRVELALQIRAAELLADPPLLAFDIHLAKLAVGVHQLLFAFHAAAEHGRVSERRIEVLTEDTARLLAGVRSPGNRSRVLAHHLVLDGFFLLYREDVQVFFRLGAKRFFGEDIEWLRLPFRWSVQYEEKLGTDIATSMFDKATGQAFAQLQRLSPLTRLLCADRLHDDFDFIDLNVVLADLELCRLTIHTILDRGLGQFMPAFAVGFRKLVDVAGHERDLHVVARFIATLALTQVFFNPDSDPRDMLDSSYKPPSNAVKFEAPAVEAEEEARGVTDSSRRDQNAKQAWGLVAAILERDEVLQMPSVDKTTMQPPLVALLKRMRTSIDLDGGRALVIKAFGKRRIDLPTHSE